jgi:hypothetical protein
MFHHLVFQIQFAFDGILPVPGFNILIYLGGILIYLDGMCSSMTFKKTVICYKQWCLVS